LIFDVDHCFQPGIRFISLVLLSIFGYFNINRNFNFNFGSGFHLHAVPISILKSISVQLQIRIFDSHPISKFIPSLDFISVSLNFNFVFASMSGLLFHFFSAIPGFDLLFPRLANRIQAISTICNSILSSLVQFKL